MEYIVASCSDEKVIQQVRDVVEKDFRDEYLLRFAENEEEFKERLNFELPELVLVDFSDPQLDAERLRDIIQRDSWLHNFGVVGLFDRQRDGEAELLDANRGMNLLALIERGRVESHLGKTLRIIAANRQLVIQDFLADKLVNRFNGSFQISNEDYLLAPVYAGLLAVSLVRLGKISPEERHGVQMCLSELVLNGIEHGNCGITYEEKSSFLATGASMADLVSQRCEDEAISSRCVSLDWDIGDEACKFSIRDGGDGFDVAAFRDKISRNQGKQDFHGRGIMMARLVADRLVYNRKGNRVTVLLNFKEGLEQAAPEGFANQESIKILAGNVLMKAGEFADCIYYVVSGTFGVYFQNQLVGRITPADIFTGEMAFLLNNTRSATVIAETNAKVIRIPRKAFVEAIKSYPQYSIFLSKLLARRIVRANANAVTRSQ
ncbi:MAG: cyclic nucleotide-binding domain-containing protein [Spirochaetales bacterium]|nr:cyclic nucleotide-binding domain-containing protein [Spirochaetales bacterium]